MSNDHENLREAKGGIFRAIEVFTEILGWLRIVLSPLLLGVFVGALIYFYFPTPTGFAIGITAVVLGLVIGIIWATKQWKGKGTVAFLSRIDATPDLDHLAEKDTFRLDNKGRKKSDS